MRGIIKKYRDFLPIGDDSKIVSLDEGDTPLLFADNLRDHINKDIDIYLKYEGLNPSGSFKDRGMTVAISKAVEEGSKAVICASTGNTSASAAAYAARGGLRASRGGPAAAPRWRGPRSRGGPRRAQAWDRLRQWVRRRSRAVR